MTTSTMKMPASYSAIEAEEMTYLDGGANNAYQAFLDIADSLTESGADGETAYGILNALLGE